MAAELDDDDIAKIQALADVIVAKVMDELAPKSDMISTSNLALGAFACAAAGKQLQRAALEKS